MHFNIINIFFTQLYDYKTLITRTKKLSVDTISNLYY